MNKSFTVILSRNEGGMRFRGREELRSVDDTASIRAKAIKPLMREFTSCPVTTTYVHLNRVSQWDRLNLVRFILFPITQFKTPHNFPISFHGSISPSLNVINVLGITVKI